MKFQPKWVMSNVASGPGKGSLFQTSGAHIWTTYFWTSSGLLRGIWLHLWMTWIPIPLADAGY